MRLHTIALLFVLFVALLFSNPAATTRAGEIIDYLPEVITARSLAVANLTVFFGILDLQRCNALPLLDELPDHLLYDENGVFHDTDTMFSIILTSQCKIFGVAQDLQEEQLSAYLADILVPIRGGQLTLPNGELIDGTKQSVRASEMSFVYALFFSDINFPSRLSSNIEFGLPEGEPCDVVKDLALHGETIELRFAAYAALSSQFRLFTDTSFLDLCSEELDLSDDELIERTKVGDIDAAISLTERIIENINAENSIDGDLEPEDALLQFQEILVKVRTELGIEILANTERFPLLTLAIANALQQFELANLFVENGLIG